MDPKLQKPPFLMTSPFSMLTELAFQLWGFGKRPAESNAPEKQVAVAVIPTKDAQSPPPAAKVARAHSSRKRTKGKARGKSPSKRTRR